jgi:hypothetical protein
MFNYGGVVSNLLILATNVPNVLTELTSTLFLFPPFSSLCMCMCVTAVVREAETKYALLTCRRRGYNLVQ